MIAPRVVRRIWEAARRRVRQRWFAEDYPARAAEVHRRLKRRIEGKRGVSNSLRDLAEKLTESAPTDAHRAVACDLSAALSNGELDQALSIATTSMRVPDLRAEKIVSRKYGYVWLCIPKVASRSIKALLCEIDPDAEVILHRNISEVYSEYPEARGYYTFAFVRNPYRRAFSFYADKYLQPDESKRRYFIEPYHGTSPTISFDDLCRWLTTPYGSDAFADRHWLSQSKQLVLDGGRLPDFVGRYENLDMDFRTVCTRLGLPVRELLHLNTMAGWASARVARLPDMHLTQRNKALLRERYAEDFALIRRLREDAADDPRIPAAQAPTAG